MTTNYTNPKEMLGYVVIQYIQKSQEFSPLVPFDRKYAFSYFRTIKNLDSWLVSFRSDMFLLDEETSERVYYKDAMPQIMQMINENKEKVYAREYEPYLYAIDKWCELIASSFPKLGLVPETGEITRAHKEDNIVETSDNNGAQRKYKSGILNSTDW